MKKIFNSNHLTLFAVLTLILSSCHSEKRDWDNAIKANSITEYQNFLKNYPTSNYIEAANNSISNIHLKEAIDCVITEFVKEIKSSGFQTERRPDRLRIRDFGADKLIKPTNKIVCSYTMDGIRSKMDGSVIEVVQGGYLKAIITVPMNHTIILGEGKFGISNGKPFLSEGMKLKIDSMSYQFKNGRLNNFE
jgi:hypothetical protein